MGALSSYLDAFALLISHSEMNCDKYKRSNSLMFKHFKNTYIKTWIINGSIPRWLEHHSLFYFYSESVNHPDFLMSRSTFCRDQFVSTDFKWQFNTLLRLFTEYRCYKITVQYKRDSDDTIAKLKYYIIYLILLY